MPLKYREIYSSESVGQISFGIKILIASPRLPNNLNKLPNAVSNAAFEAARTIGNETCAALLAADPETAKQAAEEKRQLLALFPNRIYVEPSKNGYWGDAWHARHLPWFVVTTEVGRFVVGWRKRVIHLDWSAVPGAKDAEALFPNEDVTKDDKSIHAWGYEKAAEYVAKVIESAYVAREDKS